MLWVWVITGQARIELGGDAFAPGAGTLAGPANPLAGPRTQELLTTLEALALLWLVDAVGFRLGILLGTAHGADI